MIKETKNNVIKRKNYDKLLENNIHLKKQVMETESKLKDAERLAAIGTTAGMVGHDIRNPLQALTSDLYLVNEELKELPDGEHKRAMQESFDSMQENINYIDKIVQDLQDYARPLKAEHKLVNLPELIDGICQTISLPDKIKLEIQVKDDLVVKTDPNFLRRALTNLVNNAAQAMPVGGTVKIMASEVQNKLCLIVSDTGNGIPDEVREKMFKPLVTTKSKGQGLGLAVVKRLVDALGGKITFESEADKGTEFFIELPLK